MRALFLAGREKASELSGQPCASTVLGMSTPAAEAIFGCRPNLLVRELAASSRRIAG